MTDKELIARLRDVYVDNTIRLTAADRIDELMRDLKTVLEREAETQVRHDNKIDALEAKLAKAADVLREILFASNDDHTGNWLDALQCGQTLMAELEKTK